MYFIGWGVDLRHRSYRMTKKISEKPITIQLFPGQEIPKSIESDLTVKGKKKLIRLMKIMDIKSLTFPELDVVTIEVYDERLWQKIEKTMNVRAG